MNRTVVGFSRLPSVSDDMAAADMEDVSASEDPVVDIGRTDVGSVESDRFTPDADRLAADTDDDDADEDEIFRTPAVSEGSEMVSSAVTASDEYSGIDVTLAADSTLSPSSSYDTLPSVAASQPDKPLFNVTSSGDEDEDNDDEGPLPQDVDSQDDGTTESSCVVRQGDIGSLTDPDQLPVVFLARLLCSQFLLTGYSCGLFPDHQVRVSVKTLALSCVGYLVDLNPRLIAMNLHKTSSEPGNSQVCWHHFKKVRGAYSST